MIKLEITHNKTFVICDTKNEEDIVSSALKIYVKLYRPTLDGRKFITENLFFSKQYFPTPFLEEFKRRILKKNVKLIINDKRLYTKLFENIFLIQELPPMWPTQVEAFEKIKENPTGIIAKATGSGKSRLILETVLNKNGRTLIVVPNTSIRESMVQLFSDSIGYKNVTDSPPTLQDDEVYSDESINRHLNNQKENLNLSDEIIEDADSSDDENHKKELTAVEKRRNLLKTMTYAVEEKSKSQQTRKERLLSSNKDIYDRNDTPEIRIKKEKRIQRFAKKNKTQEITRLKREKRKAISKIKKKIKPVTIICFQALQNISKEYLRSVEVLIIDECHHASASSIRSALIDMDNAQYRYCFSATPWRDTESEFLLLISAIGENVLYELRGKEAVEKGIISKPKLIVVKPETNGISKLKNDREILEEGIIYNVPRNIAIVEEAIKLYEDGHNVFVAVNEIAHIEVLYERFTALKVDPIIVHGEMEKKEKERNVKIIGKEKGQMLSIGTMAIGEGTDMPNISAVVLGAGGKSTIRLLQRIGRGSRKTQEEFIVVDFKDTQHTRLYNHFKERYKTFMNEFEEVSELNLSKLKKYNNRN